MSDFKMKLNVFNQDCAEITVHYSHKVKASNRYKVTCSRDAFNILQPNWKNIDYRETFRILLLNRGNKVLGSTEIGTGGISGVSVDVKLIFQAALKANASAIVLAHYAKKLLMQSFFMSIALKRSI